MQLDPCVFMVIKSCTSQLPVINIEPQGADQMQACPCIGAQAYNVAGVGRDFRFKEDNGKNDLISKCD